jgi:hypothetical protein
MTSFFIQAGSPRATRTCDPNDESLPEAIETLFLMDTEYAFIAWNTIYIPLSYKYDLGLMVDDILGIIEGIQASSRGSQVVDWPSNTFAAKWNLQWNDGVIEIRSNWRCVLGHTEALLNSKPCVELSTEGFVAEWKRPLQAIEHALAGAGYEIPALGRLRRVLSKCPHEGRLYRDA